MQVRAATILQGIGRVTGFSKGIFSGSIMRFFSDLASNLFQHFVCSLMTVLGSSGPQAAQGVGGLSPVLGETSRMMRNNTH
jgi:hypothetical protein